MVSCRAEVNAVCSSFYPTFLSGFSVKPYAKGLQAGLIHKFHILAATSIHHTYQMYSFRPVQS